MKEIGGYLELDWLVKKPYHENIIELNTARNALIYLIKSKRIEKLYIPYYLCDSISGILEMYKVEFEYYNIDKLFNPIFNIDLNTKEYLYIVNYYGQINNEKIIKLKERHTNIIVDNTQSFYQDALLGVDTIYSCRKFFGVPDGAYLYTDTILKQNLEVDISKDRMTHILGRFEVNASDYYKDFKENDEVFKVLSLKEMSYLTRNILGAIDYDKVREIRNQNFIYLHENLKSTNILEIILPDGAFAYPYYVANGVEVRKKLINKKIYIPTLWPNVINDNYKDSIEYDYAANILPLPCDQRYSVEDMQILLKEMLK